MFVSYYWITKKKEKKEKTEAAAVFQSQFCVSHHLKCFTDHTNPDSNPQAGLWVPNLWMKRAGRGLPRVMR